MANTDRETEKYYEEVTDMLRSPGWGHLMKDVQDQIQYLSNIRTVQTEAEMNHRKGQLMILDNLMSLETAVENVRDSYEEGAE